MWEWVVVWLLILGGGSMWLALLAREVVRKGLRLADDVAAASERASAAAGPAGADGGRPTMASHEPGGSS